MAEVGEQKKKKGSGNNARVEKGMVLQFVMLSISNASARLHLLGGIRDCKIPSRKNVTMAAM